MEYSDGQVTIYAVQENTYLQLGALLTQKRSVLDYILITNRIIGITYQGLKLPEVGLLMVPINYQVLPESLATSIFHCQPFYFNPLLITRILVRAAELQFGSKVRGICFYDVNASAALFLFMLMLVVHPFVLLLDRYRRTAHHLIAKIWALSAVTPFLKIEFEGLENLPPPNTPAVYVSNHQSFLDIYALLTLGRSFKFISKTAIFLIPVIGWAMYLMGLIPLKRMDSRSHMRKRMRNGGEGWGGTDCVSAVSFQGVGGKGAATMVGYGAV
ncbi:hypothetical protein RJ640_007323, partial [Escallonia rubra]